MPPSLSQIKGNRFKRTTFNQIPPMMMVPEEDWGPTVYHNDRRYYTTPTKQLYPSVTTFLGWFDDGKWYEEWIAYVGKEKAEQITEQACIRGEVIHGCLEKYVKNDPTYDELDSGKWRAMFNQIRRRLDKHLNSVIYAEHALYSERLKLAGRCDLCGIWDNELAIIDFKGSGRIKKAENIEDYFLQATTYAVMHMEMYGVLPEKLVILIAVEQDFVKECQVMVEETRKWIPKLMDKVNKFHAETDWYQDLPTV